MWILAIVILFAIFYSIGKSESAKSTKQPPTQAQTSKNTIQKAKYDAETKKLYQKAYRELKNHLQKSNERFNKRCAKSRDRDVYAQVKKYCLTAYNNAINTLKKIEKKDDGRQIRRIMSDPESSYNMTITFLDSAFNGVSDPVMDARSKMDRLKNRIDDLERQIRY